MHVKMSLFPKSVGCRCSDEGNDGFHEVDDEREIRVCYFLARQTLAMHVRSCTFLNCRETII